MLAMSLEMKSEEATALIAEIHRAFGSFAQPSLYIIDDLYEPERLDYEEMLGGKPREEIEAIDFGLVSWSPMTYLSPQAVGYLLPRLVELAEDGSTDRDGDLFLMRFILYISLGPSCELFSLFTLEQRSLIAAYLQHVKRHHIQIVADACRDDTLEEAIQAWSAV